MADERQIDLTVTNVDLPGDPDEIAQALRQAVEAELDRQATEERIIDAHAKSSMHVKI